MRSMLAAIVLVTTSATASEAIPIVDYSFTPGLSEHVEVPFGVRFAQTFFVGMSGLLTGLDLTIGPPATGDIAIDIFGTNGGLPDLAKLLATTTLPASHWPYRDHYIADVDSYRHVDIAPFAVSAGDLLAVSIRQAVPTTAPFYWYGSNDAEAAGALFLLTGTNWNEAAIFDMAFQTYVDSDPAQSVPEPTTLGLLTLGLVGCAARRKWNRWCAR